jgi:hypothetical protein
MKDATLNRFNEYISVTLFTLASIVAAALYASVRMRLDVSMHVLILIFLAAFFIRLPFLWEEEQGINLNFVFASNLTYGIIYYFVFELRRLKDMLESDSIAILETKKQRTRVYLIIFYIVYVSGNAGILITFRIFIQYFPEIWTQNRSIFDVLTMIRFTVRVV